MNVGPNPYRQVVVCLLGVALTLTSAATLASDRSMRCGGHLIHAGGGRDAALMYEVLRKCGEPESKRDNVWVYTQGSMQRFLTFKPDGRLLRIESGKR